MKTLILFLAVTLAASGQALERVKPSEVPQREGYAGLYDQERSMGCFVASADRAAKIVTIDCSRAMPLSDRKKTVRDFCVVEFGQRLVAAWVDTKTRAIMLCETERNR